MFNVTVVNLTPDLHSAQPDLGAHDLGAIDANRLEIILTSFRALDAIQIHDAEPQVVIEARRGKYIVRTGHGKLFLYNARDSSVPYAELEPAQIVQELGSAATTAETPATPALRASTAPHHAIGAAILAVGLLLNGYTVYSVFYVDDVNRRPPIQLVTDQRELAGIRLSVPGRYATGKEPGDRIIDVAADGSVRFMRVLSTGERTDSADTYRIGRGADGITYLTTVDNGLIEIRNIDSIVYYRDTYHRAR